MEKKIQKTIQTYNEYAEKYFQINYPVDVIKNILNFLLKILMGRKY